MAKAARKVRTPRPRTLKNEGVTTEMVIDLRTSATGVPVAVKFGSVSVTIGRVPAEEVSRNVALGQSAMARARVAIIKPGVTIDVPAGVALYQADPEHPDRLVRTVDGKSDHGLFEGGRFKVTG